MRSGGAQRDARPGAGNGGLRIAASFAAVIVLSRFLPDSFLETHLWFLLGVCRIPWWTLVLLLATAFLLGRGLRKSVTAPVQRARGRFGDIPIGLAGIALLFLLFCTLRDRTHTVGDAPQFMPLVEVLYFEFAPHAPLWNRLARVVVTAVYHATAMPPSLAYALLVASLGSVGVALAVRWAKKDARSVLFLWGALAGQGVQILFGQVEAYALAYICEMLFVLSAWRMLRDGEPWWRPALFGGLAIVSGAWNLLFVPALLTLLMGVFHDATSRRRALTQAAGFVLLSLAPLVLIGGYSGLQQAVGARNASSMTVFFPPSEGLWQVWTLEHATGLVNLVLALGLPMIFWLTAPRVSRADAVRQAASDNTGTRWGEIIFAWSSVLPVLVFSLVWYPVFGYRRDIDLFAFAVPPLIAVLCWRGPLSRITPSWNNLDRGTRSVLLLAVLPTVAAVSVNAGVWADDWAGRAIRSMQRPISESFSERRILGARDSSDLFEILTEEIGACPESTAGLVGVVNEDVIRDWQQRPPSEGDSHGWALDLLIAADGNPMILDRWGRMIRKREGLVSIHARFPSPHPSSRFAALAGMPDGSYALAATDGRVYTWNGEATGATWQRVCTSFRTRGLPRYFQAVDVDFDTSRNEMVVLDNVCGLHFPERGTRLEAIHTHTNLGRRLLRNPYVEDPWTDSWCIMTSFGRLSETTRPFQPPWRSPFMHATIVDGLLAADGRGAWLLDLFGGVHSVGDAPAVETFYPLPTIGRFVRMALSEDGHTLYLLDRAYRVYALDILSP